MEERERPEYVCYRNWVYTMVKVGDNERVRRYGV
jgi:hypothetical protein